MLKISNLLKKRPKSGQGSKKKMKKKEYGPTDIKWNLKKIMGIRAFPPT
jgi:hypothetical protein